MNQTIKISADELKNKEDFSEYIFKRAQEEREAYAKQTKEFLELYLGVKSEDEPERTADDL